MHELDKSHSESFFKPLVKVEKGLGTPICGNTPVIGRGNAGNNKLFVDIDSTTDRVDDL